MNEGIAARFFARHLDGRLGESEYRRRFALLFGGQAARVSGEELALEGAVAAAREEVARTQDEIFDLAGDLAGRTLDWPAVVALVQEEQEATLPADCDVPERYRGELRRIVRHLDEVGEFPPVTADDVELASYPAAMRDAGAGTGWPASLRGSFDRAPFVLHPDPAAHPAAWVAVLAVHEGVPGHALQSLAFRRHFGGHEAPVRFLAVADDVAVCRQNLAAMPAIEGWAVHAEERMRASGLHSGRDRLFACVAHALRQVRVLAEIALHVEEKPSEEVADLVARVAGLPDGRPEVERCQRGPLQALAYALGAASLARARGRSGESWPAFHERVLRAGPVPPDLLCTGNGRRSLRKIGCSPHEMAAGRRDFMARQPRKPGAQERQGEGRLPRRPDAPARPETRGRRKEDEEDRAPRGPGASRPCAGHAAGPAPGADPYAETVIRSRTPSAWDLPGEAPPEPRAAGGPPGDRLEPPPTEPPMRAEAPMPAEAASESDLTIPITDLLRDEVAPAADEEAPQREAEGAGGEEKTRLDGPPRDAPPRRRHRPNAGGLTPGNRSWRSRRPPR